MGWAGLTLPCFCWIVGECVAGAFVILRCSVNCVSKVHMLFVIGVVGQCFLFGGMEVNDNIMDHGSIHNSECQRMEFSKQNRVLARMGFEETREALAEASSRQGSLSDLPSGILGFSF